MIEFKIPDNDSNLPLKDTHYYKWLLKNKVKDVFDVRVKKYYLKEKAYFVKGKDKLSLDDYFKLKEIEMYYYDMNVRNNLNKYKYGIFEETFKHNRIK